MKKSKILPFLLIISNIFSLCSCGKKVEENISEFQDYTIIKDASYGEHERHLLDIVYPNNVSSVHALVFCIHGGGWTAGEKDSYISQSVDYASKYNVASVAINYRYVSRKTGLQDIEEDITTAMIYSKNRLVNLGISIDECYLTGGSAGGHLSMLYGYKHSNEIFNIKGIFAYSPVCSIYSDSFIKESEFKDEKGMTEFAGRLIKIKNATRKDLDENISLLKEYSPVDFVKADVPYTLIMQGENDRIAPYADAVECAKKLESCSASFDFITFKNSGHGLENDENATKIANEIIDKILLSTTKTV